jgi:hypothetical protein
MARTTNSDRLLRSPVHLLHGAWANPRQHISDGAFDKRIDVMGLTGEVTAHG